MTLNLVYWLLLVLVTALSTSLCICAWRAKRPFIKWPGFLLASLLSLVLLFLTVTAARGLYMIHEPGGSPVVELEVAGTPEQIARGEHLANTMCVGCHSTDDQLPLSGGRDIGADSWLPLGSFISVNLTPAGPLKDWSDGEIMRALTEGVDRNGRRLIVMSGNNVRYLSRDDKEAVIAFLRSQPPVVNDMPDPPDRPTLLTAVLGGSGVLSMQPLLASEIVAPPRGATAEFGKYLVSFQDCRSCHGRDLTGGTNPVLPRGPNLRAVKSWTAAQFVMTIRTGKNPGEHALSDVMPWKIFARLDDVELLAVYSYLQTLGSAE